MSLKEVVRAGESGGRKAAVLNEQLPSQHPLPKPTRDISASNRSHSLTHQEPPLFPSHRRLLLSRETEEAELDKQANMVYTRQFRTLAKLMGDQGMEFEELREKVEGLVLSDRPAHDPQLVQRIQTLQWELSRRVVETRSSQNLPASQEYLRGLETELGRKSKMITELSDSVKREAFEEAVRGLQLEIEAKTIELKAVEEQAQEVRLRTNANLSLLEEELIRHKQTIQKLTFELDSQKRRAQTASEDVERYRRREKELSISLENEGKAIYQGLSYSPHALVRQLQTRDQELSNSLSEQHSLQEDLSSLRRQQLQTEQLLRQTQQERHATQAKLEFEQSQRERLLDEIEQVTRELRLSNQVVTEANSTQQALLAEKERTEAELRDTAQQLRETVHQMREIEAGMHQLQAERTNWTRKMDEDEATIANLRVELQQVRRQFEESNFSLTQLHDRNQSLESQVAEWTRAIRFQQEDVMLREREMEQLKGQMALREEEFIRLEGELARRDGDLAHREEEYTRIETDYRQMHSQFQLREEEFTRREIAFRLKEEQLMASDAEHQKREEELHQSISLKSLQFQQQIQSLRTTLTNFEVIRQQQAQRQLSLQGKSTMLQQQILELTQTITRQSSAITDRDAQLLTLEQRIEAFQQEKDILLHRLDTTEQEHAITVQRKQHLQEMVRGRAAVEAELSTHQNELRQLRLLLEEAGVKEAQLEVEQEQRELHTRELEEELKRQRLHYEGRASEQGRLLQQLQDQLELDKQAHERRVDEESRLRDELVEELDSLRVAIRELEERHSNELRAQAELLSRTEHQRMEMAQHCDEQQMRNQQLLQEIDELRTDQHQLTATIEWHNQQTASTQAREAQMQRRFHTDLQQLQGEVNELIAAIQQLKHERAELERELEAQRTRPRQNELSSFSFNHFEAHQQPLPSPPSIDYQAIILELEHQLESQKRQLDEQHVRLSYSNTFQGSPLFTSLQSDCDHLSTENRRLEELLLSQQGDYSVKEQELGEIMTEVQTLRERLDEEERLLHEQGATIEHLRSELGQQSDSLTSAQQQRNHLEQAVRQREEESSQLQLRYGLQLERCSRLEAEISSIRLQLQCMREAREVKQITVELQRTKGELSLATQEILKLQAEIAATFKQLEGARREAEIERRQSSLLKRQAEEYEHRVSELEERRKREESDEAHRMLSRLSKRSNVSEQELEEGRSKGSSDGELSRRILNDPSKISGQESKFAHHLLVFENSKIHVMREPTVEISPEREIKEQRQEQSVLSRQQQQNKTPDSSHRQINNPSPTHTHFDRPSNDNSHSRRDAKESQQNFSESRESRRQSNHSLTSIRQVEEVQEGSMPPQVSPVSSVHREAEAKPKEYLPQQSSKKTVSNPNQSRQSISNANESRQNIVNHSQFKPVKQEEPKLPQPVKEDPQSPSFHRGSYHNIPIYIARPSALQPQERRESSQSQSGSKTKVRISYGQPSDKSIEIKRREGPREGREMAGSQVSRVSMQSNQLAEGSINQVSPINPRPSNTPTHTQPSLFSSQRREQSRPSMHNPNADQLEPPSDSIINGINQLASRISTLPNARPSNLPDPRYSQASELSRHDHLRRESSPIYIHPRIEIAHSPRHSNFIASPAARTINPQVVRDTLRAETKKDELIVPAGKIVMRSVIGGKRNSLLNDTATFGKSSGRGPINQTFTDSNDSGIDVVQMEWMGACCKNN